MRRHRIDALELHWLADRGAAIQNMLLAAQAQGLGGVWQELYPYHKRVVVVRDLLGIPDSVYPMAVVAIGPPVNLPEPADRSGLEKVKRNRW